MLSVFRIGVTALPEMRVPRSLICHSFMRVDVYKRQVVYNDIIENSAAIIADGTKRAALLDGDRTDLFKFDWSQFDE